ncbi:tRNA-guanine transglycosylase [Shewanella sp. 10N.286.51.B8]|uniref:tRNA-guanine transglycosylase n=1 Tax=Shewanella sp. 10N.286.51.B8 TaxID=3229708 RepID=UPI00354CF9B6
MAITSISTANGEVRFPNFSPVTTFGDKYPLDRLLRPYLPKLSQSVMVSHYYAQFMKLDERPKCPLLIDSGGFAALFSNTRIRKIKGLGTLIIESEDKTETLTPEKVLRFQESIADIAFTLDFPIPPKTLLREAKRRQALTIANALWALENRTNSSMKLFACIQAWDEQSAKTNALAYKAKGFDGIAIGGLVPRIRNREIVEKIVKSVRETVPDLPIHIFGIGKPETIRWLIELGANSFDTSSYVQSAASGNCWGLDKIQVQTNQFEKMLISLSNLSKFTQYSLPPNISWQIEQLFNLNEDKL